MREFCTWDGTFMWRESSGSSCDAKGTGLAGFMHLWASSSDVAASSKMRVWRCYWGGLGWCFGVESDIALESMHLLGVSRFFTTERAKGKIGCSYSAYSLQLPWVVGHGEIESFLRTGNPFFHVVSM